MIIKKVTMILMNKNFWIRILMKTYNKIKQEKIKKFKKVLKNKLLRAKLHANLFNKKYFLE